MGRPTRSRLAPVAAGERVHVLDVLRGFALFGVLLANMVWWFSGYRSLDAEAAAALPTAALDGVVLELQWFFVDGKFISIFSFLFGVGFAIQMRRAGERSVEITPVYVRRMLWLLLFGVAHMFFLYYGDILHMYAVLGLLLIGWANRSDKALVASGLAFTILVPFAIRATLQAMPIISGGAVDPAAASRQVTLAGARHDRHGGWSETVQSPGSYWSHRGDTPMSRSALLLLLVFTAACAHSPAARSAQPTIATRADLAITHVDIVDVTDGAVLPDRTVLLSGNRISAVGPSRDVAVPQGTRVVDATGKYLIPGLWDMHVHTLHPWSVPVYFPLYIALGVTGVREMGNSYIPLDSILAVRRRVQQGELLGPRFVFSGHELDAAPKHWPHSIEVRDAEHGRGLVDSLSSAGADFIKVYENLPRDVYYAIVQRAGERNLPVVGHTPQALTPAEVSDAGQRSIEHDGKIAVSCTHGGDAFYDAAANWQDVSPAEMDSLAAQLLRGYDPALCQPLFQRFVRNGTWIVPTLTMARGYAFLNDSALINDPRIRFAPPALRRTLWSYEAGPTQDRSEAGWDLQRDLFRLDLRVVGELHRAGVQILAGSDAPNPFAYYGFGLHDELEFMVEAGLTPLAALQAATLNPARFLEATDSLGTVEAGKLADLVLLAANPLEDIRNTRAINGVVVDGRFLDRRALNALLEAAARGGMQESARQ